MDAHTSPIDVIIGAGPVGSALASRLTSDGRSVRVVTRSGTGPTVAGIERVALDATDAAALAAVSHAASVIYNCANPGSYMQWREQWPPLAAAILEAARRSGAVLVTMSNLYGYGPVTQPITRDTPLKPSDHKGELRAGMWLDALAAHEAGEARVTEARASDYIGPTLGSAGLISLFAGSTLVGKPAYVFSSPDVPHTWTAVEDVAHTLAVLGRTEAAWGSAWLVPSNAPRTVREALTDLNAAVGLGAPALRRVPRWVMRAGGAVVPLLREVNGVLYQFDEPFIADGHETTEAFGLQPTPWPEIVAATATAWLERARAGRSRRET